MNGVKPNKLMRARRDAIIEMGCIVCLKFYDIWTPCTWHHLDGQKSQEKHLLTIGLCTGIEGHHGPNNNKCSVHNNKNQFEILFGTVEELLIYQNELLPMGVLK